MSRVSSSFHERLTGVLTSSAPLWLPACQTQKTAPVGSTKTPIEPASMTWKGGTITCPPASATFLAVSSAFAVAMYVDHTGGVPGAIGGVVAATIFPFERSIV